MFPYAVLVILVGVLALVATATVPVLFGYHTYVVHGGSMGSSLKAGSVAVSKPTSPYALDVGDIIARRESPDSQTVLHRIIEISDVDGERLFVTRGDANRTPDPQPLALQGTGDKVIYSVPYAGYILNFAGSWPGRLLLIGLPLASFGFMSSGAMRRSPGQKRGPGIELGDGGRRSSPAVTLPATTDTDVPDIAPVPLDLSSPSPLEMTSAPQSPRKLGSSERRRWYEIPGLMPLPLAVAVRLEQAERSQATASGHQTEPERQRGEDDEATFLREELKRLRSRVRALAPPATASGSATPEQATGAASKQQTEPERQREDRRVA